MNFEHTTVFNFKGALRGMRNPKESYHLSDSYCGYSDKTPYFKHFLNKTVDNWIKYIQKKAQEKEISISSEQESQIRNAIFVWLQKNCWIDSEENESYFFLIGPNDMDLARRLINAGNEHRKFMRQIFISVDITAPLYW